MVPPNLFSTYVVLCKYCQWLSKCYTESIFWAWALGIFLKLKAVNQGAVEKVHPASLVRQTWAWFLAPLSMSYVFGHVA